jgi:hypothetical protein
MNVQRYVELYHIAQDVLGSNLVKLIENDDEIRSEWISKEEWLMLPLPSEVSMNDAKNRMEPNIYISIYDDDKYVEIGIEANTLHCVHQLKNILHEFHNKEKSDILEKIHQLDDSFSTRVNRKIKDKHFSQRPEYKQMFLIQSNELNNDSIDEMFLVTDTIRKSGLHLKEIRGTPHPIETPTIELISTKFQNDDEVFKQKLQSIKPIFEICLNIKTKTELNKREKEKIVVICTKCKEIISENEFANDIFCQKCRSFLKKTKMKNIDESYHLRSD